MNCPKRTTSQNHANAGPAKRKPRADVWNIPVRIEM